MIGAGLGIVAVLMDKLKDSYQSFNNNNDNNKISKDIIGIPTSLVY